MRIDGATPAATTSGLDAAAHHTGYCARVGGFGSLNLCSERWATRDHGHRVGDLDSQCVIVTLAHICNVQASEFLQAGVRQARNFLAALGPLGEWLSTEELGGRRSAHDLLLEKSHDFFMLRTFFLELFAAKRLGSST